MPSIGQWPAVVKINWTIAPSLRRGRCVIARAFPEHSEGLSVLPMGQCLHRYLPIAETYCAGVRLHLQKAKSGRQLLREMRGWLRCQSRRCFKWLALTSACRRPQAPRACSSMGQVGNRPSWHFQVKWIQVNGHWVDGGNRTPHDIPGGKRNRRQGDGVRVAIQRPQYSGFPASPVKLIPLTPAKSMISLVKLASRNSLRAN